MFAPICLSAEAGVRGVPLERVNAALSLGATHWPLFRYIVLPGALPEILTGLRIALGIGCMTMSASNFLATDVVLFGMAVIAARAFVFFYALRWLEPVLAPAHGKE